MKEKIDLGDRGTYHTDNKINELTSKEWLKFTKSWFIHNPKPRKVGEILHPAKFPESMIKEFILFFTKPNALVLDPFLGTGSALVACAESGRIGIGIELLEKYATIAQSRVNHLPTQNKQRVIVGDSKNIDSIWLEQNLPNADFVITSPPYGNMLNKKGLAQEQRNALNLDTVYSNSKDDLGNMQEYNGFIQALADIFVKIKQFMNSGAYLVVILQNYMDGKEYKPLAFDVAKELSRYFLFRGEKIWCQDNKTLYPYGYRYSFVPNVHHHFCLIFKKE